MRPCIGFRHKASRRLEHTVSCHVVLALKQPFRIVFHSKVAARDRLRSQVLLSNLRFAVPIFVVPNDTLFLDK